MRQGNETQVHLCGYGLVSDLGVDAVSEVQGRCTLAYRLLFALGGKDRYLTAYQVIMDDIQ